MFVQYPVTVAVPGHLPPILCVDTISVEAADNMSTRKQIENCLLVSQNAMIPFKLSVLYQIRI